MRNNIVVESGEAEVSLRRPGRIAAAAAALALMLGACGNGNDTEQRVPRDVNAVSARPAPEVAELAYYHQLDLLGTVWRAPEKINVSGQNVNVYREFDSLKTAGTIVALANAVHNSLLLEEFVNGNSSESEFSLRPSREVHHQFFIFESQQRLAVADSEGLYGPVTTNLVDAQGKTFENVTLLAPFPDSAFLYSSSLNGSLFDQQAAVCGNMLDVTPAQTANSGNYNAKAIADKAMEIKQALCENLALAVTIKSGREKITHLGSDYSYYSVITRALNNEADESGSYMPRLQLTQEQYDKIVV